MRLSIIVPVYNVIDYLEDCVRSLLAQDIIDYEIVLVDDGSSDGSGELCDQFAREDSRISVLHKANGGLGSARNAGMSIACGDYLWFVDSDDYILENCLSMLCSKAEERSLDLLLFCAYSFEDGARGMSSNYQRNNDLDSVMSGEQCLRKSLDAGEYFASVCLRLFRRAYVESLGLRFDEEHIHEDEAFSFLALAKARKVMSIGTAVYLRRYRPGSIMSTRTIRRSFDGYSSAIGQILTDGQEKPGTVIPALHEGYVTDLMIALIRLYAVADEEARADLHNELETLITQVNLNCMRRSLIMRLAERNIDAAAYFLLCRRRVGEVIRIWRARLSSICFESSSVINAALLSLPTRPHATLLLGTPLHGNIGDHLIASAERGFLFHVVGTHTLEFSMPFSMKYLDFLARHVRNGDIVAVSGGGWLGTEWRHDEDFVRNVIRAFPNNRIVIFPQTAYYAGDPGYLERGVRVYSSHGNLRMFLRDETSYRLVCDNGFITNTSDVKLIPDMALYYPLWHRMPGEDELQGGGHVGVCLRDDREALLTDGDRELIIQSVAAIDSSWKEVDTNPSGARVRRCRRERTVAAKLCEIAGLALLITDRLHAMIIAAITGTPCIALDNTTHKVAGVYRWLEDLDYIRFCKSADEAVDAIEQMHLSKHKGEFVRWQSSSYIESLSNAFVKVKDN